MSESTTAPQDTVVTARSPRRRRWLAAGIAAAAGVAGTVGGVAYAAHSFPDVPAGSYYDDAVDWAWDHGLTTGVGGTGLFMPHKEITRAEVVTFLHRYHESFGPTVTYAAKVDGGSGTVSNAVGVDAATRTAVGQYDVEFDRDVSDCVLGVTTHTAGGVGRIGGIYSISGDTVKVRTAKHDGALQNASFHITATCATPA